jgi:hypothetical protein
LIIRPVRLTRGSLGVAIASCSEDFFTVVFIVLRSGAFLCLFDFDIGNGGGNGGGGGEGIHEGDEDVIHDAVEEGK